MKAFADKQTLSDLNLNGWYKPNSILRLFDKVVTAGGRRLIENMFQHPLTNHDAINIRSNIFQYFRTHHVLFPFKAEEFSLMENYLGKGFGNTGLGVGLKHIGWKIIELTVQDNKYQLLKNEVSKTLEMLNLFQGFIYKLTVLKGPYQVEAERIKNIYNHEILRKVQNQASLDGLSFLTLVKLDHLFGVRLHEQLRQLMEAIFNLDVYIAVSAVAREKDFCFARALPASENSLTVNGLYHPTVKNAVGNDLMLDGNNNVLFLTGANMAGKSTLMKSLGVCLYLAHMGFPVAAAEMEFAVKDGLFSSINVPDDISLGYSHFYAEVLRVKEVARAVAASKDIIVIFDELFKGTNVKDAYDATLEITKAFSENRNCIFIISTHIIEVGEALRSQCDNFRFAYLPTVMNGAKPTYTYNLAEGITADKQGMIIIENEGIIEMIRSGADMPLNYAKK